MDISAWPYVSLLLALLCGVAFIESSINRRTLSPELTFDAVGEVAARGNFLGCFTSPFLHAGALHLAFNMLALWSLSDFEFEIGHRTFFWVCVAVLLVKPLVHLALLALASWGLPAAVTSKLALRVPSVGLSGLLFALVTLRACVFSGSWALLGGAVTIPGSLVPWVVLAITHLLAQRLSLMAHLSGIITGYITALALRSSTFTNYSIKLFWKMDGFPLPPAGNAVLFSAAAVVAWLFVAAGRKQVCAVLNAAFHQGQSQHQHHDHHHHGHGHDHGHSHGYTNGDRSNERAPLWHGNHNDGYGVV